MHVECYLQIEFTKGTTIYDRQNEEYTGYRWHCQVVSNQIGNE
jgi:predicted restriction endonuclease